MSFLFANKLSVFKIVLKRVSIEIPFSVTKSSFIFITELSVV